MTDEIFGLYKLIAQARSRRPSGGQDLSEAEFLTLDTLTKDSQLTIGEVQKQIGVVPAQMSRVIRALETQGGKGYVECHINSSDRRRINVSITKSGKDALEAFRISRLGSIDRILTVLKPEDRMTFVRILRRVRQAFESQLGK